MSRQAEWGLRTIAYVEEHSRTSSPEAAALGQALRGLKTLQSFLMTLVRNTQCMHDVMKIVQTHGVSTETIHACQEQLGALPPRTPIRKEVSGYVQRYLPLVASSSTPLLGSSDVIESCIGKAKQRLDAYGCTELNKSILLLPCMCGELTPDFVADALTTVHVADVTPGLRTQWAILCNQSAEEHCLVLALVSQGQKLPNPLLIQDKDFYSLRTARQSRCQSSPKLP